MLLAKESFKAQNGIWKFIKMIYCIYLIIINYVIFSHFQNITLHVICLSEWLPCRDYMTLYFDVAAN